MDKYFFEIDTVKNLFCCENSPVGWSKSICEDLDTSQEGLADLSAEVFSVKVLQMIQIQLGEGFEDVSDDFCELTEEWGCVPWNL